MISLYGSTGFIGSIYLSLYPDQVVVIPRDQRIPDTNEALYFISTTDNYNIFSDPFLDVETNLKVLIETLEECKNTENIVFNFISSWFVYGQTADLPVNEETYCNPTGFYSITKRAAEQLLISYCQTFGLKYRILRLCNVFGPGDSRASKKRNALQYLIERVVKNKDINLYHNGEVTRDFMYVVDVCRAINLIVKSGPLNTIMNIGSGLGISFKEIMTYVREQTNSTSKFLSVPPPDFHKIVQVRDMTLEISKLELLGFKPHYSIWQGMDIIINHLK